MTRKLLSGVFAALLVLAGCGDDDDSDEGASQTTIEEGEATDEEEKPDAHAVTGLDTAFGQNGVAAMPLSATDHDRFLAVAAAKTGSYVAGYTSSAGDSAMALVHLDEAGAMDTAFGQEGIASVNVAAGGKVAELARGVVEQSDGKVVIAGPVEKDPKATGDAAKDNDIAVVRFDTKGQPDAAFGTNGVARLDLGPGKATPDGGYITDNSWGLVVLRDGRIVVFGSTPAPGRDDTDAVLAALTSAGKPDSAFGTKGVLRIDRPGTLDNARALRVASDGKLVGTGYSRDPAGVVSPYLVRASAAGVLDDTFGEGGVATTTAVLPGGVAESYSFGFLGDGYVTAGYGRGADANEKLDMISMRFTAAGELDTTWGTDGLLRIDVAGFDDRGRNLVVLPDGEHVLLVGVGTPAADAADAMAVLVDRDGRPVTGFGTDGKVLSDLGGPSDAWFSGAVSGDGKVLTLVGYKGVVEGAGGNDDAAVARIKLS